MSNKIKLLLFSIFIIIFICIIRFSNFSVNENFYTIPAPTLAIARIQSLLDDGYNKMNTHRFNYIDNQNKLDIINNRVNVLLSKINKTFTNNTTPDTTTMKFY